MKFSSAVVLFLATLSEDVVDCAIITTKPMNQSHNDDGNHYNSKEKERVHLRSRQYLKGAQEAPSTTRRKLRPVDICPPVDGSCSPDPAQSPVQCNGCFYAGVCEAANAGFDVNNE